LSYWSNVFVFGWADDLESYSLEVGCGCQPDTSSDRFEVKLRHQTLLCLVGHLGQLEGSPNLAGALKPRHVVRWRPVPVCMTQSAIWARVSTTEQETENQLAQLRAGRPGSDDGSTPVRSRSSPWSRILSHKGSGAPVLRRCFWTRVLRRATAAARPGRPVCLRNDRFRTHLKVTRPGDRPHRRSMTSGGSTGWASIGPALARRAR
jgi:hypothetical protein